MKDGLLPDAFLGKRVWIRIIVVRMSPFELYLSYSLNSLKGVI